MKNMKINFTQTTKRSQKRFVICLVALIVLFAQHSRHAGAVAAQGNCAALANEVKSLEAQRTSLQKDLQKAAGSGEKQGLIQQIKQVNAQIQQKQGQLDKCQNTSEVL